jgi:hypothetical protein
MRPHCVALACVPLSHVKSAIGTVFAVTYGLSGTSGTCGELAAQSALYFQVGVRSVGALLSMVGCYMRHCRATLAL